MVLAAVCSSQDYCYDDDDDDDVVNIDKSVGIPAKYTHEGTDQTGR